MADAKPKGPQDSHFPVAQVEPVPTTGQAVGLVVSRLWIATLACLVVALVLVWLQVRAGGPVIDAHGNLVGLSTVMAGPEIGLAVPSGVVGALVDRLLA